MKPLYIIEEHHEAFYIWNKATEAGFLPPFGNTLLHVDHHPDFECGIYGAEMEALFSSLEDMRDFTYSSLGIADFICPAIYQGIFNEIVIVKNYTIVLSKPIDKFVRLHADGCLTAEDFSPLSRLFMSNPNANHRVFSYSQGGLGTLDCPQTLALDIDIDYFCWDDSLSGVENKRVEITAQAYREVVENPYHPFRLFPKAILRPEEENGKYYLHYSGLPKPNPLPEKERIQKRIDLFIEWLKRNSIDPCVISLCRSRHSGYTPPAIWEELERKLLEELAGVYAYDLQS